LIWNAKAEKLQHAMRPSLQLGRYDMGLAVTGTLPERPTSRKAGAPETVMLIELLSMYRFYHLLFFRLFLNVAL
jgi:hypothetical protein